MKFKRFSYQIESITPLRVVSETGDRTFRGAVAQICSKVYVVSTDAGMVYVGSSRQPIRSRLYGALRATGAGGYYGYAWKNSPDRLHLDVWIFPDIAGEKGKRCMEAETIEAELVYLVRQVQGNWPLHQTEIHFHQSSKSHREAAKAIFDSIRVLRGNQTPP